ncbi:class I SAM-dependent methyltransferase [Clostridium tagluense]|uniref:class I SAM-dependent methyltransferase n=1 Tax=Clostridium tagluense TaxID=360422 RepID=UPI001C6E30DA|nr:class I SAM-dependent methyltransferase [Clostridium tagluense]MBW9159036.1 class I SAM-dependent methyltransferase [Clostridium tagluense]WLC63619.1 class I SAM-dependent methyltransferase [Clostridium tagluense]
MDNVSKEIIENYVDFEEENRLKDDFGRFEKEYTQKLILENCNNKDIEIYDVGGATGPYSFWLSDLSYNVHLIDITPKHIEIANKKAMNHRPLRSCIVADARKLPFKDNSADLVMLHGPLYHLADKNDRINVLKEAYRVLKKEGKLLAFTITRYAGMNYGLSESLIFDDTYFSVIKNEILTGVRDNNPPKIKSFLKAYFHLPEEIEQELVESGFKVEKTVGILGTAWNVRDLGKCLDNPIKKERLMEIAKLMENQPVLSPRMMSIGKKQ